MPKIKRYIYTFRAIEEDIPPEHGLLRWLSEAMVLVVAVSGNDDEVYSKWSQLIVSFKPTNLWSKLY